MNSALNVLLLAAALLGGALTYLSLISIELFMLLLLVVSGGVWLVDRFALRAKRAEDQKEPLWIEYSKSFFPVILAVFLLRSFLVEPFKIPSGSMTPTLLEGDFILVNKFTFGIRLPVANVKLVEINSPKRGDVMVFRYPEDPSVDYIKRVVGLPGDVIEYRDKQLTINGAVQQQRHDGDYNYMSRSGMFMHTEQAAENLGGRVHAILINPDRPLLNVESVSDFPHREDCSFSESMFRCTVPAGSYFMMGDNRDDSRDSRYWGFVPDKLIVGKAFAIWMNFGDLKRIGSAIN